MAEKKKGFFGQLKVIGLIILVVLLGIVVFQNTEATTLKFLAWEVNAPRVLLYPGLIAIGFLAGMLTLALVQRSKRKGAKAGGK